MAQSQLRTGPNMKLAISYEAGAGEERTIGYASGFTFTVAQGQKATFVVDSPFAAEISQGGAPSFIKGTVTLYMPKGSNPVKAGLVPPTNGFNGPSDFPRMATSKYLHWRFYDRFTHELSWAINFCKVGTWTVVAQAKSHVIVTLNFEGMFIEQGNS